MFTLPVKTEWMKEQMEHEATRAYAEDLHTLADKIKFRNGLEIGCMWGVSAVALLLGSPKARLTSVDKSNYTHAPEETNEAGVRDRWHFINLESTKYWQEVADTFDFIYVDGDHHYQQASEDITNAWQRLTEGGVLAVDDVLHKYNSGEHKEKYGVALAAWELVKATQSIPRFCGNLLWFRK